MRQILKAAKGFTMVESLVAVAIVAAMVTGGATMVNAGLSMKKKSKILTNNMNLRKRIIETVNNETAWGNTVLNTSNMGCLRDRTACTAGSPQSFSLRTDTNIPITNPASGSLGFTEDLLPCNSYDQTNGNGACPYKVDLQWQAICSSSVSGSCLNPQIEINGTISYFPGSSLGGFAGTTTLTKTALNFYRQDATNTSSSACRALNGIYNSDDATCQLPISQRECSTGQIVASISPEGVITCKSLYVANCGAGQVLMGFNANGTARCENIKPTCCSTPPCVTLGSSVPSVSDGGDGGCDGDGGGGDGDGGCQ